MSFLGRLFSKRGEPLLGQAEKLVQADQVNAAGIFTPLWDRFPSLNSVDTEQWDFCLTVAGVFMAASRLNNLSVGDKREDRLMEIVADHLNRWKPDGIRGFEDCKVLYQLEFDRLTAAGHEPRFVATDAVGIWIVWNVFGHSPRGEEECELVRATGALVTHAFFDWWDE